MFCFVLKEIYQLIKKLVAKKIVKSNVSKVISSNNKLKIELAFIFYNALLLHKKTQFAYFRFRR